MLGSVVCWWNGLNSKLLLTPAFSFPNDCVYAMVNRTKQNERMLIRERYVKDLSDKMHSPSVNGLSEGWLRDHSQRDEMPFSNWGQKSRKKKTRQGQKRGEDKCTCWTWNRGHGVALKRLQILLPPATAMSFVPTWESGRFSTMDQLRAWKTSIEWMRMYFRFLASEIKQDATRDN